MRSGLTTLGIVIGIAAIVALMSYTQGFEVAITNQFTEGFATNTVTVSTRGAAFRPGSDGGTTQISNFTLSVNDTSLIEDLSYVNVASAIVSEQAQLNNSDMNFPINVLGIDFASYQDIYSTTFVAASGEIPSTPSEYDAVIGSSVADPWNNGTIFAEVGDLITLSTTLIDGMSRTQVYINVTVVAILDELGTSFSGPSDSGIYIPIDTACDFFNTSEASSIIVQLVDDSEDTIDTATTGIAALFNDEVSVTSATAMLDQLSTMLGTVELLLGGIAAISLIVAGIGIMNIMIVSIMERTREIGILKALGAKGGTVLGIFLAEATMIGIFGGFFGIITGYLIGFLLSGLFSGFSIGMGRVPTGQATTGTLSTTITPIVTPELAFMAMFFGILVSVVFALYPARRASKLQPVDALRNE